MVGLDVASAVGGGIGFDMAGGAVCHADLVFVEADCDLACADQAFFGGGVAVKLWPIFFDPLTGSRAANDESD